LLPSGFCHFKQQIAAKVALLRKENQICSHLQLCRWMIGYRVGAIFEQNQITSGPHDLRWMKVWDLEVKIVKVINGE
jgi:hypothetical protein